MTRLIASLCGTALLALAMSAHAATPTVPVLNWNPCSPDGAVCAAAQVPLDYDDPAGPQTYVVLARYPVNPATKIGTVFVNFGGPGVSGVTRLIQSGFGLTLRGLLQGKFDVVAFDPRGVGYSDPMQCFDTEGDRTAFRARIRSSRSSTTRNGRTSTHTVRLAHAASGVGSRLRCT